VRRKQNSYFLIWLRPDSYFGDGIQHAKQFFFIRLPQMTKYFGMRECEHIGDTSIWSQEGISIFKFPERFLMIPCAEISLSWLH
jgi:hypothetical protein